jgi:hypothetical protein
VLFVVKPFTAMRVLIIITIVAMAVLGCRKEKKAESRRREVLLPGMFQPGTVDEAAAIALARRCVSSNDTWAGRAVYEARRRNGGWLVTATRIEGYSSQGKPLAVYGGDRFIEIDERGAVTSYSRGL